MILLCLMLEDSVRYSINYYILRTEMFLTVLQYYGLRHKSNVLKEIYIYRQKVFKYIFLSTHLQKCCQYYIQYKSEILAKIHYFVLDLFNLKIHFYRNR